MHGTFIVFEGPDGSGTTTQTFLLAERLRGKGIALIHTEEPTEGSHGRRIREILRGKEKLKPQEMQEQFCLDRKEHVERVIAPALKSHMLVLCDRYIPSTMVYGEAGGVSQELLLQWNEGFPEPDLLFVTLPPFEVSWERIAERGIQDAFEREPFQRTVHNLYEKYAREHPEAKIIDTSRRVEQSAEEIWEIVEKFLAL